jgi:hypothetical protein
MEIFVLKYAESLIAVLILIIGFIIRKWIAEDKEHKFHTNQKLNLIIADIGTLKMDYQLLKSSHTELGSRLTAEGMRISAAEAKIEANNVRIVGIEKDLNLLHSHHFRNHPEDKQ